MRRDSLLDFFRDFEHRPEVFLVFFDGVRTWSYTYAQAGRAARAFASRLRETGLAKGDKVLLWCESRTEWVVALWGCLLEGVVVVPVDYRASFDYVLRLHNVVSAKLLAIGADVEAGAIDIPVWNLHQWDWTATGDASNTEITKDDLAEIIFTSGATADPKGVLITHRNVLANIVPIETEVRKYLKYAKPFQPIRFVNLLPLSHMFGQSMGTFIPPMLAGQTLFLRTQSPEAILREIHDRRISVMVSVPKMLETIRDYISARYPEVLDRPERMHWTRRWWKYRRVHSRFGWKFWAFIVGGAPLDPELEEFWSRLGFVVIQGYGLTETAPVVTLNHPFHARKGSVGKKIAGVEIRIADDGEVLVRGENVTQGYFGGEGGATRSFQDGWLHTGDIGELDSEGNLRILGRKKEMIVTPAGMKVFPEDVERVLDDIPGVVESAVVGKDRVHAVLSLASGSDPNTVVRTANERLEDHQKIRGFSLWPAGPLPRTEGTKKLRRKAIEDWVVTGRDIPAHTSGDPIVALLSKYAPGREVGPDTTLEELGLGSLERVELLIELEQRLGTRISETSVTAGTTVSQLREPVQEVASEPIDYPYWTWGRVATAVRWVVLNTLVFPLARYYARLAVSGREKLSKLKGPVIFAPNHQTHMDVPVIYRALPSNLRYHVAPAMSQEFFDAHFHPERHTAREVFTNRLNYILSTLCFRAFPLSQRGANTRDAMEYMGRLAGAGVSILVFPEGKLTETGEIADFQPGVALLAQKLQLPVVPVRLHGLEKVLHRSAKWATPGKVKVVFGDPVEWKGEELHAFACRIRNEVEKL